MMKSFIVAAVLSSAALAAAVVPAQARISESDCSYARQVQGQDGGVNRGSSNYNYTNQLVEQCQEQGK